MKKRIDMSCLVLGTLLGSLVWADPAQPTLGELKRKAAIIKPTPQESRWRQIRWLTDLAEAQRLAREEQRPILLFASAYDPLERC